MKVDFHQQMFFFTLFLLLTLPVSLAQEQELNQLIGIYVGTALNGGNYDKVTTEINFNNGRLTGTYSVEDETGIFQGHLSNFIREGERSYSLEWTDQYGEGYVYWEFSADYSSFSGYWGSLDSEQQYPWNGSRQ